MNTDTQQRETELEAQAWQEIEDAGHNVPAVEDYRDNMGHAYTPLYKADEDGEAVMAWEDWISDFEDAFTGSDDAKGYAEELADEMIAEYSYANPASDFFSAYFDYAKWERDLFLGDYWTGSNGYVFRNL